MTLVEWLNQPDLLKPLFDFVFYYPLTMAWLWIIGGLFYYFHYERHDLKRDRPRLKSAPFVSILVPCYNEEENVEEVVAALNELDYPDFEIICINDGSRDRTGELLDRLLERYPRLRVIQQAKNQGKAVGLNTAALVARGDFLLCIDGDAVLDPRLIPWMVRHFESPRVAAVTGNPRIRTRTTLLGKIQVGEFSSIIGLIKRTQRVYGRVFTVSGVCVMFRKSALHQVGYWSPEMLTEDIDITWKLQLAHWEVRYEPRALCWILMPETFKGLWKQRLRWAMGGVQVVGKYAHALLHWRKRRMWPVYLEYVTSIVWSYAMLLVFVLWGLTLLWPGIPHGLHVGSMLPSWHGVVIGVTCLTQFAVSLWIDRHYDTKILRYLFWTIWYPLAYWMLNMLTATWAVPKVLARGRGKRAVWSSPDRGVRSAPSPPAPGVSGERS
ncbi:MAG: poly-beta-1,6-N-acetyl-D-glucosamine synthase [Casimicrobiaceae bacterium]|nr:poly-beta-1,6-N-acetyl-D-glucosamine synthase [Casimicrobiaceae bacterium]MCX8097731.1 poly-beta-1,6-N-acetyl-D-glucosamine synthase [Casimicrobiaceae bacterium]MDW8312303.1 poly-beta-1,6-N-acetyl-D-glucosamine synthase [Burkholderiales bacterium]